MSATDARRPSTRQVYEIEWEGDTYAVESVLELSTFLIGIASIDQSVRVTISTRHVLDEAFLRYPAIPFDRFVG